MSELHLGYTDMIIEEIDAVLAEVTPEHLILMEVVRVQGVQEATDASG